MCGDHHRFRGLETEESDGFVVGVWRAFVSSEEFAGEDAIPVDAVALGTVDGYGVAEDG